MPHIKKVRLDTLLVDRGLFSDEAAALRGIMAHEVKVNDAYATSAALMVRPDAVIGVKGKPLFVSRGGYKLQRALDAFDLDVSGLRCVDVGCSTGGFTDCLLQAGAQSVAAVDVGYGDLAWKLRSDPRVHVFERTNIRHADPLELGAPFDLIVADVSFISLAQLAPVFAQLAHEGSFFVGLIKPQFESLHDETDSRGFVASEDVRARTIEEVTAAIQEVGFAVDGVIESPIHGRKSGNVEYLLKACLV